MADERIGLGFIGAGDIVRTRHLPGFEDIPGVEFAAVANRSRESASRVAADFGIAEVCGDWREVIDHPNVDAVVIGTWPYKHGEYGTAALEAGKHVFTQARLAMDAADARRMVAAAAKSGLTTMVCPPPHGMRVEPDRHADGRGRLSRRPGTRRRPGLSAQLRRGRDSPPLASGLRVFRVPHLDFGNLRRNRRQVVRVRRRSIRRRRDFHVRSGRLPTVRVPAPWTDRTRSLSPVEWRAAQPRLLRSAASSALRQETLSRDTGCADRSDTSSMRTACCARRLRTGWRRRFRSRPPTRGAGELNKSSSRRSGKAAAATLRGKKG